MSASNSTPELDTSLAQRLEAAGQGHVLEALDRLDGESRHRLRDEIAGIDWETVANLGERIVSGDPPQAEQEFAPPDVFPLHRNPEQRARAAAATAAGERLLAAGQVGAVVVAGGQASRLGLDRPKGTVAAGPVSGWSLFELFSRKLQATEAKFGMPVPFYVMTSPTNDAATKAFFAENDSFGLEPDNVVFFTQGVMPALDDRGRVLFTRPDALALAPTGHGGVFSALRTSGALDDMADRGVEYLSYFQVDNPLVIATDPLFIGLHSLAGAGMSSKVVSRSGPDEKVGVIGRVDGRHTCIEYSNLPDGLRNARNEDGSLRFGAGNIAMHVISTDFARTTAGSALSLPWTLAYKRMTVLDDAGEPVEQMAYKAETFVFDALGLSDTTVTLEVDRSVEFSPIKNATGPNSPATARADMCALHAGWAKAAGMPLPPADDSGVIPVEVDPLFAVSEREFLARMPAEPVVTSRGHLYVIQV